MSEAPIIIAGGGIAGLAAAVALHKLGHPVRVLESYPELKPVGAGLILAPNALDAVRRFSPELADQMIAVGYSSDVYKIKNDKGSILSEVNIGKNFSPSYAISRPELYKLLLDMLPEGTVSFGCRAVRFQERITDEQVQLVLDSGEILAARAILGCDGVHSMIRGQLLPEIQPRYAGYTCWRGIVNDPELAHEVSHTFTETWGAKGRFGVVPLSGGRLYWFALYKAPFKDPAAITVTPEQLLSRFAAFHFPIPQLLERVTADSMIHTDLIDTRSLPQYAFGRVLLLGDAAHAMTPNLGQGACQALEDAAVLYECVQQYSTLPSAFKAFAQVRMPRCERIAETSWKIGQIAQLERPLLCRIRNTLMRFMPSTLEKRQMAWLYHMPQSHINQSLKPK
ncbi:MAG: FAD-dependent monooxygenase [Paenibacillus sp.]|nr:FAD-dependent monooxygenase [Paenibacillus sp.]